MPAEFIVPLDQIDANRVQYDIEAIRRCNPQRFEMEQLDGVVHIDTDEGFAVGYKDVTDDEFWVKGHIPERPLLPGVLMCEAAAQLCSFYYNEVVENDKFLGFGGLQDVKFRRPVEPGCRLIIVAKAQDMRPRRAVFPCQAFVEGKMVFECVVIGT